MVDLTLATPRRAVISVFSADFSRLDEEHEIADQPYLIDGVPFEPAEAVRSGLDWVLRAQGADGRAALARVDGVGSVIAPMTSIGSAGLGRLAVTGSDVSAWTVSQSPPPAGPCEATARRSLVSRDAISPGPVVALGALNVGAVVGESRSTLLVFPGCSDIVALQHLDEIGPTSPIPVEWSPRAQLVESGGVLIRVAQFAGEIEVATIEPTTGLLDAPESVFRRPVGDVGSGFFAVGDGAGAFVLAVETIDASRGTQAVAVVRFVPAGAQAQVSFDGQLHEILMTPDSIFVAVTPALTLTRLTCAS